MLPLRRTDAHYRKWKQMHWKRSSSLTVRSRCTGNEAVCFSKSLPSRQVRQLLDLAILAGALQFQLRRRNQMKRERRQMDLTLSLKQRMGLRSVR